MGASTFVFFSASFAVTDQHAGAGSAERAPARQNTCVCHQMVLV
jgi:hypothetical protein